MWGRKNINSFLTPLFPSSHRKICSVGRLLYSHLYSGRVWAHSRCVSQSFMPLIPCFDNHCFNCPFQFSVKLTEEISAHCWTLWAAKHVCFLVGRNDSWPSKLVQYLLLWFFHNTRHLHLPLGVQSPAQSQCLFL